MLFPAGSLGWVAMIPPLVLSWKAVFAAEVPTMDDVVDPGPNQADERLAGEFSPARAVQFLDAASLSWQKTRKCLACHTNCAYLQARPVLPGQTPAAANVRAYAEELVAKRWKTQGPRWAAEVVATAAALALNDAATTGRLHSLTRIALDRMWTVQRKDGGWDWLKCGWPPMESDDHYGATLAAVAVGYAPDAYAQTEAAQRGMASLQEYFRQHPPETLHQQAMLLWADSRQESLMSEADEQTCIRRLVELQRDDGGWSAATLGPWQRQDGKPQETTLSDGYGTGFVIFVLRQAGIPSDDARIQRGVSWLKSHQRASGRWFSRSLNKDSKHFLTHAGTAMAILALAACGEFDEGGSK